MSEKNSLLDNVIFAQERIGKDGIPFFVYKIRTMEHDADKNAPEYLLHGDDKKKEDPRILPGRAWMRRCGFDELPQIMNIIRGEMTFFGPRPTSLDRYEQYSDRQKQERDRVKPGYFGGYGFYGKGTKKRSMSRLEDIYLYLRKRREREGKSFILFNTCIVLNAIKAILQGVNK